MLVVPLPRLFRSTRWTRWLNATRPPRSLVMRARAMSTSESNTNFGLCTVSCPEVVAWSNNCTRLSFYDLAFSTHDWFSTLSSDRPMKLPGLLYVKPKTNHYGCPIRVIIRLNSGLGDYGVAKWLPWGLNSNIEVFLPRRTQTPGNIEQGLSDSVVVPLPQYSPYSQWRCLIMAYTVNGFAIYCHTVWTGGIFSIYHSPGL